MRKNTSFRILKLWMITAVLAALGCTVQAQEVLAVGIHVDENATQTEGDGKEPQEEKSGEKSKTGQDAAEESDKSEETSETVPGIESIELVRGDMPALQQLKDAAAGRTDIRRVMLAENGSVSSVATTPGAFDISEGNITLSENGGYEQIDKLDAVVSTGTQGDEQYIVTGSTGEYNIHVESGAAPTIQVQGMQINMLPDVAKKGGIYIEAGASVTLVLGTADTILTGSQFMPGITLEPGASLNISGAGVLNVSGGAGADGISGVDNSQGGTLKVEGGARLHVYSDQEAACNVKVSSISNKILQGTLETPVSTGTNTKIQAENKNDRTEKYPMVLPAGYRSFAVSTTADGGEYVSYFPGADGNVQDSHLLVDKNTPARHSYNLTGAGNTLLLLAI